MQETKRPSLREAARRGVEANRQQQATAPPRPAPAVVAPVKPAVVKVHAACGHDVPFVADPKDKHPQGRLDKATGRPCKECRATAHAEREAAEQAARREKEQQRRERPKPRLGRLPDGANFNVTWNTEAGLWRGTLTVPMGGNYNATVVSAEESAVFTLLQSLDRAYRKMPAEEAAPTENAPESPGKPASSTTELLPKF